MLTLPLIQVDAFTDTVFKGNPAAVCPVSDFPADKVMQAIANENNLSETAFVKEVATNRFFIRWFTPVDEIDLCGHATLASAAVLFKQGRVTGDTLTFETKVAGELVVQQVGEQRFRMALPARPGCQVPTDERLSGAFNGQTVLETRLSRDLLVVMESESVVRSLNPDMALLREIEGFAFIATAPADAPELDFVSRVFCPDLGDINEDPVTGSAHCTLVPYWADRLGKMRLKAYQASSRGGYLDCELDVGQVYLTGDAAFYLEGHITLPSE